MPRRSFEDVPHKERFLAPSYAALLTELSADAVAGRAQEHWNRVVTEWEARRFGDAEELITDGQVCRIRYLDLQDELTTWLGACPRPSQLWVGGCFSFGFWMVRRMQPIHLTLANRLIECLETHADVPEAMMLAPAISAVYSELEVVWRRRVRDVCAKHREALSAGGGLPTQAVNAILEARD